MRYRAKTSEPTDNTCVGTRIPSDCHHRDSADIVPESIGFDGETCPLERYGGGVHVKANIIISSTTASGAFLRRVYDILEISATKPPEMQMRPTYTLYTHETDSARYIISLYTYTRHTFWRLFGVLSHVRLVCGTTNVSV